MGFGPEWNKRAALNYDALQKPKMCSALKRPSEEISMNHVSDLGRRIELVPMDPHGDEITIALYEEGGGRDGAAFRVHSYSPRPGARGRVGFVRAAMAALGGLEPLGEAPALLRFACGNDHRLACRRVFLEACKLASGTELAARPLSVEDRRSARTMRAVGLGGGAYRLEADGEDEATRARLEATIANGLVKLAEMERAPGGAVEVAFACGRAHDAIVGLLLPRALNVRAALREQEAAAARGILAAPSAQER